jgi:predicted lactoylglutathione lyase
MEPTIGCITLPVDDIGRALTFYRDGLGLPAEGFAGYAEGDDHVAIELKGGLYLVLILRSEFAEFTSAAHQAAAVPETSECILSCFTSSKEEVDAILGRSEAAGGFVPGEAMDQPWGYAGYVKDPDGHLWEIMWNPHLLSTAGSP